MKFLPLTPERWPDLEALFGERGACAGCWCMWWRLARSQFEKTKGAANKRAFRKIVQSGAGPGLLAYSGGQPVGWCAIAPRETFPVIERSRALKRVDEKAVWSAPCLFIARSHRGKGVSTQLLRAAAKYAARRGAKIVEGYPVEARKGRMPDAFAWTGLVSAFCKAGFVEVARPSATRAIMRRVL